MNVAQFEDDVRLSTDSWDSPKLPSDSIRAAIRAIYKTSADDALDWHQPVTNAESRISRDGLIAWCMNSADISYGRFAQSLVYYDEILDGLVNSYVQSIRRLDSAIAVDNGGNVAVGNNQSSGGYPAESMTDDDLLAWLADTDSLIQDTQAAPTRVEAAAPNAERFQIDLAELRYSGNTMRQRDRRR